MSYKETLEKIHSLNKFGSRPGLERVSELLRRLGSPHNGLRFVHVAGTNGKGSVSSAVASVLTASGYRTGLFISPYITDFCERIQIDLTPISHEDLESVAEYVFTFLEELNDEGIIITEFEFVMCVAFEYFKRQGTDIVVLEVGLGGRLDCTNVILAPECVALTRIGLDHTDILGNTVSEIANEKCGIIKSGTKVVSSPQPTEAVAVIENVCKELGVELRFSENIPLQIISSDLRGTVFSYKGREYHLHLTGEHQIENVKTALGVLEVLTASGFDRITPDSEVQGIFNTTNPARFELLGEKPVVILDGAHNPDGMSTFSQAVKKYFPEDNGILIIGMLSDKDSASSVKYIEGLFSTVYTVPISNPRALSSEEMAKVCEPYFECVIPCRSIEEAFDEANRQAMLRDTHLCVCGSLYLAGEIRPYAMKKTNG